MFSQATTHLAAPGLSQDPSVAPTDSDFLSNSDPRDLRTSRAENSRPEDTASWRIATRRHRDL